MERELTLNHFKRGFPTSLLRVAIIIDIHHIHSVHLALHYIGIDVARIHALKVTDVCKDKAMVMVPARNENCFNAAISHGYGMHVARF